MTSLGIHDCQIQARHDRVVHEHQVEHPRGHGRDSERRWQYPEPSTRALRLDAPNTAGCSLAPLASAMSPVQAGERVEMGMVMAPGIPLTAMS